MGWHLDRLDRLCWLKSCNNRLPETVQDENRQGPRRERPGTGQQETRERPGRGQEAARKRPGRGQEEDRARPEGFRRGRRTSGAAGGFPHDAETFRRPGSLPAAPRRLEVVFRPHPVDWKRFLKRRSKTGTARRLATSAPRNKARKEKDREAA